MSVSQIFKSGSPNDVLIPYQVRLNTTKQCVLIGSESQCSCLLSTDLQARTASFPEYLLSLFALQYCFGLRSGEILGIMSKNCTPEGFILIKGSKRSKNRLIFFPPYVQAFNINFSCASYRVATISYRAYYSHLKRHGIEFKVDPSRKNFAVTHSARHNRIKVLEQQLDVSDCDLSEFIGHKSKSAINYYKISEGYNED